MPYALPLTADVPSYRVGTVLDGTQYILDVRWNSRAEAWYMDVLDADEDPIASGLKIVLGALIGARVVDTRFPPGALMAVDLTSSGEEATLTDLGSRVVVYYLTEAELAE